jgi:hypothetical protein
VTSRRVRLLLGGLALAAGLATESGAQGPRPGAAGIRDVLILRSGEMKEGALQGCTPQDCTFGGSPVRRDAIVLIGLRIGALSPPQVRDPQQDEVHLVDRSIESGTLLTIDAARVVTERRAVPRGRVAWIYLATRTSEPAGAAAAKDFPLYVWEGRVEVENRFQGRTLAVDVHGRHLWQGVYDVRFREAAGGAAEPDAAGRPLPVLAFVPVALTYTIRVLDHHHEYDHRWGDVVMQGEARGGLADAALDEALQGRLGRLDAPVAAPAGAPPSFPTWSAFHAFLGQAARPGCYLVTLAFRGAPPEKRALYRGIQRTGSAPITPDPDQDFLRVMPAYMPDGINVQGCLDRPDQAEARGAYTFPGNDPNAWPEVPQITIRWSFARRRL